MRVWDCHPAVLATKHLSAQHGEVHFAIRCVEGGWRTRWKDVYRWRDHPQGLDWLYVIHDATVGELLRRGRFHTHATPVPAPAERVLNSMCVALAAGPDSYLSWLTAFGYPLTELNEGTPWERDRTSFEWYAGARDSYSRAAAAAASKAEM